MIQLSTSPHKVSPKSQFQFIITYNGLKEYFYYFDDGKKPGSLPFLDGLNSLTKKYKTKSLLSIARILDKKLPKNIPVDKYLAKFLASNKSKLFSDNQLKKTYFKSDQVLVAGETYKRVSYVKLIKRFLKSSKNSKSLSTDHLFNMMTEDGMGIRCNFDIGLYDNGVYLINPSLNNSNNPFSLIDKNNNFIGITSLSSNLKSLYKDELLLNSEKSSIPASVCLINNQQTNKSMSLISFKGRDPGQFLHSLLNFKIENVTNKNELTQSLNYPRHLFLLSPQRIVLESTKSSSREIQSFLDLGLPLYHSQSLGDVWTSVEFNRGTKEQNSHFITDTRQESFSTCHK